MKKFLKNAMGLTLAVCMTIAPMNFAKASEATQAPTETQTPAPSETPTATPEPTQTPAPSVSNTLSDSKGAKVKNMKPYTYTTGETSDLSKLNVYNIIVAGKSDGTTTKGEFIIPVSIPAKGILVVSGAMDTAMDCEYLYQDAACSPSKSIYISSNGLANVPAKGTYYLKFEVSDSSSDQKNGYRAQVGFGFLSGANKIMKNKTWTTTGFVNSSTPVYYKVSTTKTSKITVDTEADYSRYITLCNAKKQPVSKECYIPASSNGKAVFVAPKGTYYIKATSNDYMMRIRSTVAGASDSSGSSKAKATSLKMNAALKKGVVTTTDKTSKVDWYKFTLSKASTVNLIFKGDVSSGKINLEVYGSSLKGSAKTYLYKVGDDGSFQCKTTTSSKLPKGTYYIKVTKDDSKTNGSYSIGIKNK